MDTGRKEGRREGGWMVSFLQFKAVFCPIFCVFIFLSLEGWRVLKCRNSWFLACSSKAFNWMFSFSSKPQQLGGRRPPPPPRGRMPPRRVSAATVGGYWERPLEGLQERFVNTAYGAVAFFKMLMSYLIKASSLVIPESHFQFRLNEEWSPPTGLRKSGCYFRPLHLYSRNTLKALPKVAPKTPRRSLPKPSSATSFLSAAVAASFLPTLWL